MQLQTQGQAGQLGRAEKRGGDSLSDSFLDVFIMAGVPKGKKWGYCSTKTLQ